MDATTHRLQLRNMPPPLNISNRVYARARGARPGSINLEMGHARDDVVGLGPARRAHLDCRARRPHKL